MSKKLGKLVTAVAIGAVVSVAGGTGANAASFYDNINYNGYLETLSSGNVTHPDRASSLRNVGLKVYCENNGCFGRTVVLNGDYNDLRAVSNNLNFGETWSDRISALK